MYRKAKDYIDDADLLAAIHDARLFAGHPDHRGSERIFRILGFEILLKCAVLASGRSYGRNHDYCELWCKLPCEDRKQIARTVEYGDLRKLFEAYQKAFIEGRYDYEKDEGKSDAERSERPDKWRARGCPDEEADFVYYPLQLEGLIHGLNDFIENKLANHTGEAET